MRLRGIAVMVVIALTEIFIAGCTDRSTGNSVSPSATQGEEVLPWGNDFEKEELRTIRATCDASATIFTDYKGFGTTLVGKRFPYAGITISVNGNKYTKYYVYVPNPDSMSPTTFSFMRADDGSLRAISADERDRQIGVEAPNILAAVEGKENDCIIERFTTGKE